MSEKTRRQSAAADDTALRSECWIRAVQTFGTARIFEVRANVLKDRLRWLSFLGLAGPLTLGGVVTSFSTTSWALTPLIVLAGLLSIALLIVSAWSLVAQWSCAFQYALGACPSNTEISGFRDRRARFS